MNQKLDSIEKCVKVLKDPDSNIKEKYNCLFQLMSRQSEAAAMALIEIFPFQKNS